MSAMSITIDCPGCGNKLRANDEVSGKRVKCPRCTTVIEVRSLASHTSLAAAPRSSSGADNASAVDALPLVAQQLPSKAVATSARASLNASGVVVDAAEADSAAAPATQLPTATPATKPQSKQRFRKERAAFIAVSSILVGILAGSSTDLGPVGLTFMVAFMMTSVYVTARVFMGIGGFMETLPPDAVVPDFDWWRFVLEPLCLLGVALAVFLFVGLCMLFRWAFTGKPG